MKTKELIITISLIALMVIAFGLCGNDELSTRQATAAAQAHAVH